MRPEEHLREEVLELATRASEIRRKALEIGQSEAARRLLVASKLLRVTPHVVAFRESTPTGRG